MESPLCCYEWLQPVHPLFSSVWGGHPVFKLNLRKKRKKHRSNWCNYSDDGETKSVAAAVDKTSGSVLLANLMLEENHLEKKKNMRRWKV